MGGAELALDVETSFFQVALYVRGVEIKVQFDKLPRLVVKRIVLLPSQ